MKDKYGRKIDIDAWTKKYFKNNPFKKYGSAFKGNNYKILNVMSNKERRRLGLPQDPDLPDYREEYENGKSQE